MNHKIRNLSYLMVCLFLLISAAGALAQEEIPTATPDVPALPTGSDASAEDAYIATLDRLATLIEYLIGFIPAGMLAAVGGVLVVIVGALYVIARLTPTKRDDELIERLWNKLVTLLEYEDEIK